MSKEIALDNLRLVRTGNCFISSVCTMFENLNPNQPLDPLGLRAALPYANEHYFSILAGLLKCHGLAEYPTEIINIPDDKRIMLDVIIAALQGGALCEISVWGNKWVNNVRGDKTPVATEEYHSIVVYGYYQPDSKENCWLYIYDPFDDKLIFKEVSEVYSAVTTYAEEKYSRRVWLNINLFGLCLDHYGLNSRFPPKENWIDGIDPNMILNRLPGETRKEKLSTVLAPN